VKKPKPKTETIANPSAETLKFFADVEAAEEDARKRIAEHGPDPVFQTKRWREKTNFPIGILWPWEAASAEFWPRIRARRCW
jgi:hypothetical protein